ncbi:MAG: outer-membrane lipoprotein carrier protein LolA [Bacilli bacterium]|nr:outer-membrane lipoprotein carrier protein LolA [Bacilli bacterium]
MKKFLGLLLVFICAICLTGCGKENEKTVLDKLEKKVNSAKGYQLDAEMELINNEDSYKYDVTVSYKKKDNYRVSLRNKTNNHEQIILKNSDGVYVLTPTLNKSFKFQSKWPYNNSQSYLLQSVINDMKKDTKLTMKKSGGNYVFKSGVNYKNNANLTHQEVVVDKNLVIKKVTVYDNDENAQIKVSFKNVDMKAKFKDNYFVLEENMETLADNTNEEETEKEMKALEEAIYPMYLPQGTYLETEKTVELDEGSRIILTFAGENPFMLVEEPASKEDDMTIIPTSGDLDIFMDSVAIVGDSSVSWVSDNVEYYLVSSDLSQAELISVAKSISTMPVGK